MKILFSSIFLVSLVIMLPALQGCGKDGGTTKLQFKTDYQAVVLDNGQAYFGKVEQSGNDYLLLKDVFYIRRVAEKKADHEEVRNILIKRGVEEWHAPEFMYVNVKHVVFIEPVTADSKVGELIKEAGKKAAAK